MLTDNGSVYTGVKLQRFAGHEILNKISISKKQAHLVGFFWGRNSNISKNVYQEKCLAFIEIKTLFFKTEKNLNYHSLCSLFGDNSEKILTPSY